MSRLFRVALVAILGLLSVNTSSGALTTAPLLVISLPGPFLGCSALQPSLSESDQAILDLTRPSAFVTSVQGALRGEAGAVQSAELVSLSPQVVTYTLDTSLRWSNGRHFGASDLMAWWRRAKSAKTVTAIGYQDISSMVSSDAGAVVTATFKTPFSAWALLFRDIEQVSNAQSLPCSRRALLARPSLGPYRLVSLTSSQALLRSNPNWTASFNRLPTVTLTSQSVLPKKHSLFVGYYPTISSSLIAAISQVPILSSHIGATDAIEEIQYSLHRSATQTSALRRAWSFLIDRSTLLRTLYGGITLTPTVATSTLFAQNEFGLQTSAPSSKATGRCISCATSLLNRAGIHHVHGTWMANGDPVHLSIVRGPSSTDRQTADALARQWRSNGLKVGITTASTHESASAEVARGSYDVAVFTRPVGANPWMASTAALGSAQSDSYSVGQGIASVKEAQQRALADFNPVTAAVKWQAVDEALQSTGDVWPLFTPPSLTAWSTSVENIAPSLSLLGLVDQVANWGSSKG